ncbi:MAG: protein kinase [Thiotrichaceae bacterium]|nr:protein kinase [Thiotrichaceae bacterium]
MPISLYKGDAPHKNYDISIPDLIHSELSVYEVGERISSGGNAVVHVCYERATGDEFAVKFQLNFSKKSISRFDKEKKLYQISSHDHLIQYVDDGEVVSQITQHRRGKRSTKEESIRFIVMDLASMNLSEELKGKLHPRYEVYAPQLRGLARGLGKLHEFALHRDIKPHNILVVGERWVLSDFGLCSFHNDTSELSRQDEVIGPRFWMSPEANNRNIGVDDEITKASDVFQLAAVFWVVVNGKHPTGVVTKNDWVGPDKLFDPIYYALHNDPYKRPKDGFEFSEEIEHAILP